MASPHLLQTAAQHAWVLPSAFAKAADSTDTANTATAMILPSMAASSGACPVPLYASSCAVSALDINVYRTNKHRRTVWEMSDSELWKCPVKGCRKSYRKTSSKSIETHKTKCPFLENSHASKDPMKMDEVKCQPSVLPIATTQPANSDRLKPVMAVMITKEPQSCNSVASSPLRTSMPSLISASNSSFFNPGPKVHAPLALLQSAMPAAAPAPLSMMPQPLILSSSSNSSSSISSSCADDCIDPIATLLALAHAQPSRSSSCSPSPLPLESFQGSVVDDDETESDSELEDVPDRHRRKRRRTHSSRSPSSPSESIRSSASPSSEVEDLHSATPMLHSFTNVATNKAMPALVPANSNRWRRMNDALQSAVVAAQAVHRYEQPATMKSMELFSSSSNLVLPASSSAIVMQPRR